MADNDVNIRLFLQDLVLDPWISLIFMGRYMRLVDICL